MFLIVAGLLALADHATAQPQFVNDARDKEARNLAIGAAVGPVIESTGAVHDFDGQDLVDASKTYKVVFDVRLTTESGGLNLGLHSAARFLNMNVAAGIPKENVQVAVVLHGQATRDAMSHEAHRERLGTDNPNLELIAELAEAGVPIYVCAQSATGLGLIDDIEAPARLVLSAFTALVRLQADGYQRVN